MMTVERQKETYSLSCDFCGERVELELYPEDVEEYMRPVRRYVQDIFPYLKPEEREMLISHICPKCWDKMFPNEEE